MALVIKSITRQGDIGEPGYSFYGELVPPSSRSGTDPWHGATQEPLADGGSWYGIPNFYVVEGLVNWFTDKEAAAFAPHIRGVVPLSFKICHQARDRFNKIVTRCVLTTDIRTFGEVRTPTDPCKDVSCPDKCVGVDKFDQVCQDGICVRGTLIETNSEHCGYTPEPTPEPTPDPTPTPTGDTYTIIIALMLAGTYMILRR